MSWTENHDQLQTRLVQLFSQKNQQKMIAIKAGLDAGNLNLEGAARENWFEIIHYATTIDKLPSLIQSGINASENDPVLIAIQNWIQKEKVNTERKTEPQIQRTDDKGKSIKKLTQEGRLGEAIKSLLDWVEEDDRLKRHENTIYGFSARFHQNENKQNKGLSTDGNYEMGRNRLREGLLSTLDQIEGDLN